MGGGNVVVSLAARGTTLALYFLLYEHRVFEIGASAGAWVLLFFAEDFTYYWWHRASHEVRLLWAAHENHRSSQPPGWSPDGSSLTAGQLRAHERYRDRPRIAWRASSR